MGGVRRRVRQRGRSAVFRAAALAGATTAHYLVAQAFGLVDPPPLLAALTAMLVVQATAASTLTHGLQRVLGVVAGVVLAVGFVSVVGLNWWSLFILVAASIVVGQLLRLGPYLIEVPISAMLVLGVGYASGAEAAALTRVMETLIGAAVGVLVNVLFPPAVRPVRGAGGAAAGRGSRRCSRRPPRGSAPVRRPVNRVRCGLRQLVPHRHRLVQHPSVDRSSGDFGLLPMPPPAGSTMRASSTATCPRVDRGWPTPKRAAGSTSGRGHATEFPEPARRARSARAVLGRGPHLLPVHRRLGPRGMPESDTRHADRARTAWAELLADLAAVVRTFGALLRAETAGPRPPRRPHWRTPWIGCAWTGCGTPRSCLWTRASTRTCGRSTAHLSRWSTGCCGSTSPRTPSCSPGGGPPSCSGSCVPGDCPASALGVEQGASIRARVRRTAPTGRSGSRGRSTRRIADDAPPRQPDGAS